MSTEPRAGRAIRGLYAVTPDGLPGAELRSRVAAALRGGAAVVQYRNKSGDTNARLREAAALRELCTHAGALFIVNDDIPLALEVDADGVHLGRDDGDLAAARARLGGRMVGASCYNDWQAAEWAVAAGVDYIAFGSFFPSRIKPLAVRADASLLTRARAELRVPVVAIGGIDLTNAGQLVSAGADALAVVSALFDTPDTEAQARRFADLFEHPHFHSETE